LYVTPCFRPPVSGREAQHFVDLKAAISPFSRKTPRVHSKEKLESPKRRLSHVPLFCSNTLRNGETQLACLAKARVVLASGCQNIVGAPWSDFVAETVSACFPLEMCHFRFVPIT